MALISESLNRVSELLLDPLEQKPSVKLKFGALLREFQNFTNELGNSSVNWTTQNFNLVVDGSTGDYLVSASNVGKILFVVNDSITTPYPLEFTDLADLSSNWWYYNPIIAARPEDYNFAPYGNQIAFYRKNGSLYAKVPTGLATTVSVTAAMGDWSSNAQLNDSPVLSEYHHLPEIRAALSLRPIAEWGANEDRNQMMRRDLLDSLMMQESRVYSQFILAKRSIVGDDIMFRESNDYLFG